MFNQLFTKTEKKIFAVTLRGRQPMAITAVMKSTGKIFMLKPITFPSDGEKLQQELVPLLIKHVKKGFEVAVDEVSGDYCRHTGAIQCVIDAPRVTPNGTEPPLITGAIKRYRELFDLQMIDLPNSGAYAIPQNLVNTQFNARGEETFQINYEALRPEHVLTLLTVYASYTRLNNTQHLMDYLKQYEKPAQMAPGELSRGMNAITAVDRLAADRADNGMAGQKIDDNTWIL